MREESPQRKRGLVAIDGAAALMALLLIVQVWLLSAALEDLLAGHPGVALPAAIFSALLFLGCLGLSFIVDRVDQDCRRQ
jgi:hypothetical protein